MKFSCDICNKDFYPHELYLIDEYGICEECRERVIKECKQENEKSWILAKNEKSADIQEVKGRKE